MYLLIKISIPLFYNPISRMILHITSTNTQQSIATHYHQSKPSTLLRSATLHLRPILHSTDPTLRILHFTPLLLPYNQLYVPHNARKQPWIHLPFTLFLSFPTFPISSFHSFPSSFFPFSPPPTPVPTPASELEAETLAEPAAVEEGKDSFRIDASSPTPSFPAKIELLKEFEEPPNIEDGIVETVETTESSRFGLAFEGFPETVETVETPFIEFVETVETVEPIEPIGANGACPAGRETPVCDETAEPPIAFCPAVIFWNSAGGGILKIEGDSLRSGSILEEKKIGWEDRTGDTESVRTTEKRGREGGTEGGSEL